MNAHDTTLLPAIRPKDRLVLEISHLRNEMDRVVSIEELQESNSRLQAFEAYAQAKGAKDITDRAVEARIWIERRAGELAHETGKKAGQLASEFNVGYTTIARWLLFASVSADELEEAISTIRANRDLSVSGVSRYLLASEQETSSHGITRLRDGRYRIRWRDPYGAWSVSTLREGGTLKDAQGRLARKKRATLVPGKTRPLDLVYAAVRRSLGDLDQSLSMLPPDARVKAEEAIAALHRAEDALVEARKLS